MSDKNLPKKPLSNQPSPDFSDEPIQVEEVKSSYDFSEFVRKRNEKNKALKIKENRQRKFKSRAA